MNLLRRRAARGLALVAAVLAGALLLVPLASGNTTGTFSLRVAYEWTGAPALCAAGHSPTVMCYERLHSSVPVSGLGLVHARYVYPVESQPRPSCADGFSVLQYPARLVVQGKGEIFVAVDGSDGCLHGPPTDTVLSLTQPFRVTGGSGVYAGASGSGLLRRENVGRAPSGHGIGTDVWESTLVVPNLVFDTTPPTIAGAAKVVRAPRRAKQVRVRYAVRATDDVDRAVRAACKPTSGSRFKVGRRTVVRCTATDSSANTATVTFTVTVRKR